MRLARTTAAAALATTLLLTAACSDSSGDDSDGGDSGSVQSVAYLTSFGNFGRDAYAWVALEKGYFREAGFEVDIKPGNATAENLKMIAAGRAAFSPVDLTGFLLAAGQGQAKDVVAVAAIQQKTMAAIMSLEGNGIAVPKDLEGKTLADSPSSVVRNLFPTYAKLAKIDESKVKWVNGTPQTLIGTLAGGGVQGIGQFVVGKPTIEAAAKGRKAVVLPYSDVMRDLYGNVLVTSKKIATENPDMVKRFTAALLKGLEYSIANPEESGEILHKHVPAAAAAPAAAELELMATYVASETGIGGIDLGRVAGSIALLETAGSIPPGVTPEQIVDASLTPKP
ncbi:ABC transporter substrate-binding protein [Plantactinospora sp. DSM 117369]